MAKPVRRVVLGITGSIAAYKAPHLVRGLIKKGVEVRCVLTPTAAQFVSPLTLTTLSKHPIAQAMSDPALWEMAHLSLASWADLVLIAPTTAHLMFQLANGGTEALPRERVKALFFMLAPGARAPSTEGDKVRVTFKDGRQVAGFSKDHRGQTSGFFVVPADNRTNTERIFIFRHAVQSISIDK